MNLARFPRRRYTHGKTPIEFLPNFTKALDGPEVYIKRDDLLGLTAGGNKTRKLEFLVADALEKGCDTLITCGAVQSNHCRLTLSAAVKEGLKCRLVLEERVADSYNPQASGNNFLFRLLGVESITVVPGGSDMAGEMQKVADQAQADGRKPYIIPGGGSTPIGALGYVACAQEIQEQLFEAGLKIDTIVVPSGSSGTHAGLVTGLHGCNLNIPLWGVNVSRDNQEQAALVHTLAVKTAELLGIRNDIPREAVVCYDQYWRPKYSVPNAMMVEAVNMMASTEGVLFDPVYTGKALAEMVDLIRKGELKRGQKVLFVHTGGSPGLYAYMPAILGEVPVAD